MEKIKVFILFWTTKSNYLLEFLKHIMGNSYRKYFGAGKISQFLSAPFYF